MTGSMDATIIFLVVLVIGFFLLVASFVAICLGWAPGGNIEFQGWGMRLSTNLPLVFSLFIGALLIGWPFYQFLKFKQQSPGVATTLGPRMIPVVCKVDYEGPVFLTVYASISHQIIENGEVKLKLPWIPDAKYALLGFKEEKGNPFAIINFDLTGEEPEIKLNMIGPATDKAPTDATPSPLRIATNATAYKPKDAAVLSGGAR